MDYTQLAANEIHSIQARRIRCTMRKSIRGGLVRTSQSLCKPAAVNNAIPELILIFNHRCTVPGAICSQRWTHASGAR